jgi:hypothetical protein
MNNELALNEVMTLGKALAESKYFSDAKEASQAVVKVLAGQELGIGPIAAMSGIYIVKGKVVIGGNILASIIKASQKYEYEIIDHGNETCVIEFFEENKSIGISKFTIEDAEMAELLKKDNWKFYPKNMLFNRALSNGAKWFCPDLFNGQSVYTPGELPGELGETESERSESGLILEPIEVKEAIDITPLPELLPATETSETTFGNLAGTLDELVKKLSGKPVEKMNWINRQISEGKLNFEPITVKEVIDIEND